MPQITLKQVAGEMADSLIYRAEEAGVDLSGLTIDNFNSYLDDAFKDGGKVRCIHFTDLGMEYAQYYGAIETAPFDTAHWRAIVLAILLVQKKIKEQP